MTILEISKEQVIKQVADKEDIPAETVRNVFNATENYIIDCLSSITPSEDVVIRLFSGIILSGAYHPERIMPSGYLKGYTVKERINAKATLSRPFKEKIRFSFRKPGTKV